MIIEKQKGNKIFLLLPRLLDISSVAVRKKIVDIVGIFSKSIIVKIISKSYEIIKRIEESIRENITINESNNKILALFKTDITKLYNLVEIVSNTNNASMELFVFDQNFDSPTVISVNEAVADLYMFITDNDGVSVIFDSKKYAYNLTLEKIKEIYI